MCIAILNPSDVTLEKSVLKNCWSNNKDGAGMLYLVDGVLTIHKEMKKMKFYRPMLFLSLSLHGLPIDDDVPKGKKIL